MSSNVAIRRAPTTVRRRSLWGSSQERCRCATIPGGEAQVAEDDVLDALAHVGAPVRDALRGLLADQVQHHRDVVRAEAPQRVLVGAQLAEVQAVAVQVVQLAPARRRRAAPSGARPRGGTRAGGPPSASAPRARPRRPPASASAAVVASGFSTKQCLPASATRTASSAWVGTGVASTTASSSGSSSSSSQLARGARAGKRCAARARACSEGSHSQRSSQPGIAAKLRARFGPQ